MTLAQLFRANLVALRRQARWSQQKLAQKAGLSVSYISMIERGRRTVPLATIEVLAKALDTLPTYMLQDNDHPQPSRRRRSSA